MEEIGKISAEVPLNDPCASQGRHHQQFLLELHHELLERAIGSFYCMHVLTEKLKETEGELRENLRMSG